MYEPRPSTRDRIATFTAVVLIHVTLAAVLINISPDARQQLPEQVVEMLDVTEPPAAEEAQSRADFETRGVPAGEYVLSFWSKKLAPRRLDVVVAPGGVVTRDVTIERP